MPQWTHLPTTDTTFRPAEISSTWLTDLWKKISTYCCMLLSFGDCLLRCIIVARGSWCRSGLIGGCIQTVSLLQTNSIGPMSLTASFPLVLLPIQLWIYKPPPHLSWALPLRPKWFSAPPQFFLCHLLDETIGTRLGQKESSTSPEAFSLLVSISKDIWFWHCRTQFRA